MKASILFWGLMIFWLLFGICWNWHNGSLTWAIAGHDLLLFIVVALLGWKVYGAAIQKD